MTDTSHRSYVVALALVVFFVTWASVAARAWGTSATDPRVEALRAREQGLRADARLVERIVDRRWAAYRIALRARRAAIAAATPRTAGAQDAPAPVVRVVTLPPLTVTRTS